MAKRTYLIGRHGNVRLNDDTVSRRHARLDVDGDTLHLRDLGSRNGTFEVRGAELVPFTAGPVERGQVFAFGECVRTVAQLIRTAELEAALARARPEPDIAIEDDRFAATSTGSLAVPRKRLSERDIVQMLERVEDETAAGREVAEICIELGITVPRYQRWCREYGETREVRANSIEMLRRENARLRKQIATLTARLDAAGMRSALRVALGDDEAAPERPRAAGAR